MSSPRRIAVLGLGYVGLPLAVGLARHYPLTGYDLDAARVDAAQARPRPHPRSRPKPRCAAQRHGFPPTTAALKGADFYIVTVPTPVDARNTPDLGAVEGRVPRHRARILAKRRHGRARKHGLSRRHRRDLRPGAGQHVRPQVRAAIFSSAIRPSASIPATREHTPRAHHQGRCRPDAAKSPPCSRQIYGAVIATATCSWRATSAPPRRPR